VLNVIAAAATVVAAVGALVTVMYARRTVLEGRAAHSEEMDERRRALVAEIRLQRLVHASRLTDLLMAIACAAPARPFHLDSQRSSIVALQAQLRVELAVFYALGGPPLPASNELESNAYADVDDRLNQRARVNALRKQAGQSLVELEHLVERDERLRLTLDEQLRLPLSRSSEGHR